MAMGPNKNVNVVGGKEKKNGVRVRVVPIQYLLYTRYLDILLIMRNGRPWLNHPHIYVNGGFFLLSISMKPPIRESLSVRFSILSPRIPVSMYGKIPQAICRISGSGIFTACTV